MAAVEPTAIDRVDEPEPGAGIEVGLRLAVTPLGAPETESASAALNPPETLVLMVELPLCPCTMDTEEGEADTVKLGQLLAATGRVDLIDCSSGGIMAKGPVIPSLHPGYQVPFAPAA